MYLEIPHSLNLLKKVIRYIAPQKKDIQEREFIEKLVKELKTSFGKSMTADEIEKSIMDARDWYGIYKKHYERLFEKTKCKALLMTCYYTDQLFPAIEAAKKRGIVVIEMQHGVINNHEEYWFEDRRGVNNYTPDILLTFGEMHNSWIKLVKGSVPIAIGYPWQEKKIKEVSDIQTEDKTIIIYPTPFALFEQILCEFADKITEKGYIVKAKIHPGESKDVDIYYPIITKNKNIEIITDQGKGIYYWLKSAKYHVMASTTVGLEAMVFPHTEVFICESIPHDQTQCLLDWGLAEGFHDGNELVTKILTAKEVNLEEKRKKKEMLWKPDAINNMQNFFSLMRDSKWSYANKGMIEE